MKYIFATLLLISLSATAYNAQVKTHNTIRKLAGVLEVENAPSSEESLLVYHSPDSKMLNKTVVVDLNNWQNFKKQANTRLDLLLKIYYANIKDVSKSNQRHVGCFFGDAEVVATQFFNNNSPIANIKNTLVTVSEDRKMLGIEFEYVYPNKKMINAHFRMPHCVQGAKSPLIDFEIVKTTKHGVDESSRNIASVQKMRVPSSVTNLENGYEVFDKINKSDEISESAKKLPRFQLRSDYDKMRPNVEARPWKGMDISTEAGAQKFSQVLLDYFYDSLIQDVNNNNNNLIAQNIKADKSQWCHMPWLNVGDSGREMIHGLTKERDLEKSAIYPLAASTKEREGSDWGIGFYNDIACSGIAKVFTSNPSKAEIANLPPPEFTKKYFPDGSVSVKVLFTTANLEDLNGSFTWTANVSGPKSTTRRLRDVKMIQIDLAVKDSTLIGTKKEIDHWVMSTYYFDASFVANSKHKFSANMAGLLKMRPIGVQTGFDPSTSMIFKGSKTNSAGNSFYGESPGLLNGPADNPKSSCLSCHGTAGTTSKMVPGMKDFAQYLKVKNNNLDFSQQMALAKRNYETRFGQK